MQRHRVVSVGRGTVIVTFAFLREAVMRISRNPKACVRTTVRTSGGCPSGARVHPGEAVCTVWLAYAMLCA
ncbi:hypothetical protein GCM10010245_28050 [Streptomyces spectabilis]|nr:hypothetical protein GCM10010245_28050 [Streptomyces spectabilis]